jgi:hypothetical protein
VKAAAVWSAVLAALCGAVVLLTALVHDPLGLAVALLLYNVVFVAALAGMVLTAFVARRWRAGGPADRRLAVAALLQVPGLLFAAYLGWGADSWAADVVLVAGLAGAAFALLSLALFPIAHRGRTIGT